MLVLTRALDEIIQIGGDVQVKVLSIDGNQVRIGVVAPKHISIDRGEVYQRKLEEGRESHVFAPVKSGKKSIPVQRKKSPLARLFGRDAR